MINGDLTAIETDERYVWQRCDSMETVCQLANRLTTMRIHTILQQEKTVQDFSSDAKWRLEVESKRTFYMVLFERIKL